MLSADFSCLKESIEAVEEAEWLHLDIMDGHFVPNITFGPCVISKIRNYTDQIFDTHLMIEEPRKYIQDFVDVGSDYITVHVEVHEDLADIGKTLNMIRDTGVKAGISINPPTPWKPYKDLLSKVDLVLVMTVNPGFGGQTFMHEVVPKIREINEHISEEDLHTEIAVDGGVSPKTAPKVVKAGADILVAGSAIFKGDAKENMQHLRDAASR